MADFEALQDYFANFFSETSIGFWDGPVISSPSQPQPSKRYPRFTSHALLKPTFPKGVGLEQVFLNRCSALIFRSQSFSYQRLSTILGSIGNKSVICETDARGRTYPSAGAKYPAETYLIALDCENLESGLYYYDVLEHTLTDLWRRDLRLPLYEATNDERVLKASAALVFTLICGRTGEKYGKRALRYSLIEIGHMAQNIYLTAASLKISCCEIGGFIDERIISWLDIDKDSETVTLVIILGGGQKEST